MGRMASDSQVCEGRNGPASPLFLIVERGADERQRALGMALEGRGGSEGSTLVFKGKRHKMCCMDSDNRSFTPR